MRVRSNHYYTISPTRMKAVATIAEHAYEDVEDYILADWPEGQSHQDWLDTAPVEDIARWADYGLHQEAMEVAED